ncbi:LysE family translocator [Roseomonas sp. 18066]|uniref:LysE family translocator n=1 Tax=Roseomonas sp. 18066 TaxID=2681412 RepID=UPI0013587BBA|nr:LysE family transporter [Roseomonas sp. 18066]
MIEGTGPGAELLRGAMLGIAVAAPIGPTALLCIQRTLAGGPRAGMAAGFGAATVHTLYAAIAAIGLIALAQVDTPLGRVLQLASAAFLLRLAWKAMTSRPQLAATGHATRPWRAYGMGLAWTLSNPLTLISFAALSPAILGQGLRPWQDLPLLAAGVALGSCLWWTLLAGVVGCLRSRLSAGKLRLANMATGAALAGFGLAVLANAAGISLHLPATAAVAAVAVAAP